VHFETLFLLSAAAASFSRSISSVDVRIRFRIGADDSTGAPGWDIDDITVSGITNTPFTALIPNVCTTTQQR
jgi:hypothetical protein